MKPKFFKTPADLRKWFGTHHASTAEVWIGFYKKASGRTSITWPESVDQALCFGWIDGIRKSIDADSYMIRFTPRRQRSIWSAVNIKRANELIAEGSMQPEGLAAFAKREENRSGIYAYEQRSAEMPEQYAKVVKRNRAAWKFFNSQTPGYRKAMNWWVLSARKEETRLMRLEKLIDYSARGLTVP